MGGLREGASLAELREMKFTMDSIQLSSKMELSI